MVLFFRFLILHFDQVSDIFDQKSLFLPPSPLVCVCVCVCVHDLCWTAVNLHALSSFLSISSCSIWSETFLVFLISVTTRKRIWANYLILFCSFRKIMWRETTTVHSLKYWRLKHDCLTLQLTGYELLS